MILARCMVTIKDPAGERNIGEVLRVSEASHLLKASYLQEIDPETPLLHCSCGRMFLRLEGEDPEQLLTAHCEALGKGHKPAKEKVPA